MEKTVGAFILIIISLEITKAQGIIDSTTNLIGIHFEQKLKWSEIITKAKAEHKYVFVDCYASWCGPCKWMDANVYTLKEVGDIYNKDFIAVKIQMDKTAVDDSLTKSRYSRAQTFEQDYHVDAYPTLLFFDPDGNPVHKVTGSLNEKQFIQLASDAKKPNKQYYAILKNFQPGKLDTSEEKGLAFAFANSDMKLAGKIASDYLSKIPTEQLKLNSNERLMYLLRDDSQVFSIAMAYIKSLKKNEWMQIDNANIVTALINKPKVKDIALAYIKSLSLKEIGESTNMKIMKALSDNVTVQNIAQNYIGQLNQKQTFREATINFIDQFTNTANDKGFKIFYEYVAKIDTVMKNKNFAQGRVQRLIYRSEFAPQLIISKKSGKAPDFDAVRSAISEKYNDVYARNVIADAKVDWYDHLVNENKETQYWPQFIQAELDRLKPLLIDNASFELYGYDVNNICYSDIFPHEDDIATLTVAVNWMKAVNEASNNMKADQLDTYACILYKAGKTREAVAVEKQALQLYTKHIAQGAQPYIDYTNKKIAAMQNGERIWEEKEFQ